MLEFFLGLPIVLFLINLWSSFVIFLFVFSDIPHRRVLFPHFHLYLWFIFYHASSWTYFPEFMFYFRFQLTAVAKFVFIFDFLTLVEQFFLHIRSFVILTCLRKTSTTFLSLFSSKDVVTQGKFLYFYRFLLFFIIYLFPFILTEVSLIISCGPFDLQLLTTYFLSISCTYQALLSVFSFIW